MDAAIAPRQEASVFNGNEVPVDALTIVPATPATDLGIQNETEKHESKTPSSRVLLRQITSIYPETPHGEKEWDQGLLDYDCSNCCWACFCPCITYGEIRHRMVYPEDRKMAGYDICNADCMLWWFLSCCFCLGATEAWSTANRTDLREQLGIRGNVFEDCASHVFCSPCALAQEQYQLVQNEDDNRTLCKLNKVDPYEARAGMRYEVKQADTNSKRKSDYEIH